MSPASGAKAQPADHYDAFAEAYARDTPVVLLPPKAVRTGRFLAFLFFTLEAEEIDDGMPR